MISDAQRTVGLNLLGFPQRSRPASTLKVLIGVASPSQSSSGSLYVMPRGLVPFWAKDIKVGFANINAKAEEIESKPAFREAFQRPRSLVPVDVFYEDRCWGEKAVPV
jgi:putative SOS response-associated peptidase YedK